ncbi:EAL domain-containing protein [Colwellia sp. MB02u-18]|uniref:bifunctional diguanylate cyclase/phosphodiesterase n=1 Tax=unclassified Colwellia TaxID=196834 RepID=UPI0015F47500|nr:MULTISPECIES: EAL domain-containing protein [unclassified Colwellia]MBA6223312.1 EAL domain-containing protein [Colwellia sp. MB3u-45]MBA6267840.1 EAL domain-containing protein [Colwellia sp. MB3u-43]MBA6322306.1 EAL domain-containing protein [Colwellia sp. MB02u-19]MBA6323881.1 EAL domain-containing protein [Colwellia sp. MB02u-18]MBA6331912.1 EAL domain-containing protein [Colwellia sp. MB02u-12]
MNPDYNVVTVEALITAYDPILVCLSILIAILSSFSAFGMVERNTSTRQSSQKIAWNLFAASVMTIGIWAMSFISMLALKPTMPVSYDVPTIILSVLPLICACSIVLWLITQQAFNYFRLLVAGLLLASAISLMHYINLATISSNTLMFHDAGLVYLASFIAVVLAIVALKIQYQAIHQSQYKFITKKHIVSAVVMGLAFSAMHYSAMTALQFIPQTPDKIIDDVAPNTLALVVTVMILLLMLPAIIIPYLLKYKQLINTVNQDAERLNAMMDTSQDALIQMNAKGDIVGWSAQAQDVFGWTSKQTVGQELANLIIPIPLRAAHKKGLEHFMATGEGPILNKIIEVEALHQDGHNLPIELTISFIKLADGFEFNALVRNISQRKQAEKALIIANEKLAFQNQEKDKRTAQLIRANQEIDKRANELTLAASVFTHALEGIVITDAENRVIDVNKKFTAITGYSREEVVGQAPIFFQTDRHPPEFYSALWQVIKSSGQWAGEILSRRKNGEKYVAGITISAVKDAVGKVSHYVALFSDITLQRYHQYQLEQMAHYDTLTKLPNRALLADRLNQTMLQCQRHHHSLAVIFMDLDGFKEVNDIYGHAIGDELLIIVSGRMSDALREVDTLARIGGDEFVAVLSDLVNAEDYKMALERLLRAASEPITVGDVVLNVSVSIGVTLYPQDDADADILIRHADQAMYMAKKAGKNCYHLFDSALDNAVNLKQENISHISSALNKHEFVLYYQPKVNMSTGEVVGVEALIRWQHPVRGLVPPLDFLPLIENHTMSLDIGEWVIDTALSQISQWQSIGITLPISVNISAYQLQQTDFVERLATLLAAHSDVSAHLLELEILETSAFSDINYIIATMKSCIGLGVQFALDDFGTGYSSLTYLRRLPANLIKIDQTFIRDMLTDADDLAIVLAVVSLAKAFQLEVIAEGVETVEHGTALLQLGCNKAQGYGIARPMPASDIPTWLSSWQPYPAWLP